MYKIFGMIFVWRKTLYTSKTLLAIIKPIFDFKGRQAIKIYFAVFFRLYNDFWRVV